MLIVPEKAKQYLRSKTRAYQIGWITAYRGDKKGKIESVSSVVKDFNLGYQDCNSYYEKVA